MAKSKCIKQPLTPALTDEQNQDLVSEFAAVECVIQSTRNTCLRVTAETPPGPDEVSPEAIDALLADVSKRVDGIFRKLDDLGVIDDGRAQAIKASTSSAATEGAEVSDTADLPEKDASAKTGDKLRDVASALNRILQVVHALAEDSIDDTVAAAELIEDAVFEQYKIVDELAGVA